MAKQTVDESLHLDVLSFARQGYLAAGSRGLCTWTRDRAAAGELLFHAGPCRLQLFYELRGDNGDEVVHRAYPVMLERTPTQFRGERIWFLCPACETRARKLYLPPGRTYFLCRTCHDLSYRSRQKRASPLAKTLAHIDTLTTTLANTRIDSRRWRRIYIEAEEAVKVFRETDFLAAPRRLLRPQSAGPSPLELPPAKRGRGRPKVKRPYVRHAPFAHGEKQSDLESLCLRCRDFRHMQDPQPVVLPGGRPALKGNCPVCGAGMCHIIKRTAKIKSPEG